jgi:hypothetical protein
MLVHGRIATLDVYAVSLMLVAAALYLRSSPLLAGLALGVGACTKLVALYLLVALALFELARLLRSRRDGASVSWWLEPRLRAFALFAGAGAVTLVALLWLLDALVPAYDPGTHVTYSGDPFSHLGHMLDYALKLRSAPSAVGIASSPWQWLLDQQPIDYARVAVNTFAGHSLIASRVLVLFRGEITPFVIFVAVPAVFAAAWSGWSRRDDVALVGACWAIGTFAPFVLQVDVGHRTSYIYYMLIVLPGVYITAAWLFSPSRVPPAATLGWAATLVYGFIHLYPLRNLSGHY